MAVCIQCGHELGIGRFCLNCGHPVDAPLDDAWRTGTAERPAVAPGPAPAPPPQTRPPTESARYPLYADEVTATPPPPLAPTRHVAPQAHRAGAPWLPWAIGALVLILVAVLGAWLMFGGDDDPTEGTESTDRTGQREPSPPGDAEDVTRQATATVPATAPPNQDVSGNPVSYAARNMLDGVPATCWRMPGDGTGEVITIELADETTLTSVGLINGYAKTAVEGATRFDWYAGNRRVAAAEWTFDDGTTVSQDLEDTREVQRVDIDPVVTSTVELTLAEVTPPGQGRAARNYTAISDLTLIGTAS